VKACSPRNAHTDAGPRRLHDGRIITDAPDLRWGTDATMAWTIEDGWVLVFDLIDHHTCEAWAHVAKVGDRFAALQPVYDAVVDRHGVLAADVARGLEVRHDWGPQYRSHHSTGSLAWLGIKTRPPIPANPNATVAPSGGSRPSRSNACGARTYRNADDLRQAVAAFVELYNSQWLIERLGHRTPKQTYQQWLATQEQAA